ncbi:Zn-ribbon domain-containing OB-fold protein [Halalkalicoccus sp. NIPERK01]|uniref:Zn-ribbon domain-containing OB-fold protein n=1 Tax=Halalkalicoccus sp. NIPERK01 TaxID=3053469 RepID=UPI00256EFFF1|nr:OB-fold domain-containing protein [Halalkalicoccus sp. NIPERK01]MDL5363645.1 OB-fold domain-containing protein [Halalkalicoccus sp. NIPERK01]
MSEQRDEGYDEWIDAIDRGEAYALECSNGHGSLPPRRLCPECGDAALEKRALPDSGTLDTYTTIHVATPAFAEDAPYTVAIVDFGLARLTGQLRGVEDPEVGMRLAVGVEERETEEEPLLVFRPA